MSKHPETLPTDAVAVLAGRHEARLVSESLTAAYWLHGRDNDTSLFLLHSAHDSLAALADAMGYTLTPKAAEASGAAIRIVTDATYAPGGWPIWRAWDDRLGADASPYGTGTTEAEAIEDLIRQIEEAAA